MNYGQREFINELLTEEKFIEYIDDIYKIYNCVSLFFRFSELTNQNSCFKLIDQNFMFINNKVIEYKMEPQDNGEYILYSTKIYEYKDENPLIKTATNPDTEKYEIFIIFDKKYNIKKITKKFPESGLSTYIDFLSNIKKVSFTDLEYVNREYNGKFYKKKRDYRHYTLLNELSFVSSEKKNIFKMRINNKNTIHLEVEFNEHNDIFKNIEIKRNNNVKKLIQEDFKDIKLGFSKFLSCEQFTSFMFKKNIIINSYINKLWITPKDVNVKNMFETSKMLEGIPIPVDQIPTEPTSYTAPAV